MKIYTMGAVTDRVPESFTWPINYSSYIGDYYEGGTSIFYSERSSQITGISTSFVNVTVFWTGSSGSTKAIIQVSPDPDFNTVRDSHIITTSETTGSIEIRNNEYFRVGFGGDNGEQIINGSVLASIGGISSGTRNIFYDGFIYSNASLTLISEPSFDSDERYDIATGTVLEWEWEITGSSLNANAVFNSIEYGLVKEAPPGYGDDDEGSWNLPTSTSYSSPSGVSPSDSFIGFGQDGNTNWIWVGLYDDYNSYNSLQLRKGDRIRVVLKWYYLTWSERLERITLRLNFPSGGDTTRPAVYTSDNDDKIVTMKQVTGLAPTQFSWSQPTVTGSTTKSWSLDDDSLGELYRVDHSYADNDPDEGGTGWFYAYVNMTNSGLSNPTNPASSGSVLLYRIELNPAIASNQAQVQFAVQHNGPPQPQDAWYGFRSSYDNTPVLNDWIVGSAAITTDHFDQVWTPGLATLNNHVLGVRFKQSTGDRNIPYFTIQLQSPEYINRSTNVSGYTFFTDATVIGTGSDVPTQGPMFKVYLDT